MDFSQKKLIDSQNEMMGRIGNLEDSQKKLIDSQKKLTDSQNEIKISISDGFKGTQKALRQFHDFGKDRINFARKITGATSFSGCASATFFSASYNGFAMDITVSHMNCNNSSDIFGKLIACDGIDVALSLNCPTFSQGVNLNFSSPLNAGDQVAVFGMNGGLINSWVGHIAAQGTKGLNSDQKEFKTSPFMGKSSHLANYVLLTGDQVPGLSGAMICNGYGVAGIAFALASPEDSSRIVVATQINDVQTCINKLGSKGRLQRISDCRGFTSIAPPIIESAFNTEEAVCEQGCSALPH